MQLGTLNEVCEQKIFIAQQCSLDCKIKVPFHMKDKHAKELKQKLSHLSDRKKVKSHIDTWKSY